MLIDPIGTYEQAKARHDEMAEAAAREAELRAQLPPSGPRVAIAAILRRLADRIDNTNFEPMDPLATRN